MDNVEMEIISENVCNLNEKYDETEIIKTCNTTLDINKEIVNESSDLNVELKDNISSDNKLIQNVENVLHTIENNLTEENIDNPLNREVYTDTKKPRKRFTVINSDSEDENINNIEKNYTGTVETLEKNSVNSDKENSTPNIEQTTQVKKFRLKKIVDSDSEEDIENTVSLQNENNLESIRNDACEENVSDELSKKKKSRLLQICDSDSEEENFADRNSNLSEENQMQEQEEKEFSENIFLNNEEINMYDKSRFKMLCDSESSDEETESIQNDNEEIQTTSKVQLTKSVKKQEKEKQMTGREALEQRRQIKSESQKMVRETSISLPYHRPKQYTLHDFLKRRSRLDDMMKVSPNTPTTFAIKMSSEQLKYTAQRLKERELEIEKFYKSSSSDEEVEEKTKESNNNKSDNNKIEEKNDEKMIAEETNTKNTLDEENNLLKNKNMQIEENQNEVENNEDENMKFEENKNDVERNENDAKLKELREILQKCIGTEENTEKTKEIQNLDEASKLEEPLIVEQVSIIETTRIEQSSFLEQTSEQLSTVEEFSSSTEVQSLIENQNLLEQSSTAVEEKNLEENSLEQPLLNQNSIKEHSLEQKSIEYSSLNELLSSTILPVKEKFEEKKIPEKENKIEEKLRKFNPLIPLKTNFKPKLSGDTNDLIILDDGLEKSKGVSDLMKRFFKHNTKKVAQRKTEINLVNLDGGLIHQESIIISEDVDSEPAKKIQIPGLKMKILRKELEEQIAKKRWDEWQKRQEEKKIDNEDEIFADEKTECGLLGNEVLDNEDEEELTDSETDSSEDEEIEDDVDLKEKPKFKSAFVDDEAEESDIEDQEDEENLETNCADEANEQDESDEDSVDDEEEDDDNVEKEKLESSTDCKKPLRRIIKAFDDDSEEEKEEMQENNVEAKINDEEKNKNSETAAQDMNLTWDETEDMLPAYQPRRDGLEKTPCKPLTEKQDISNLLTPTLNLTALQGMGSTSKVQLHDSPDITLSFSQEISPLKSHPFLKTKLFSDENEEDNPLDELENLCSGKFTNPTQLQNEMHEEDKRNSDLSTQESALLDVCTGRFTDRETKENTTEDVTVNTISANSQNSTSENLQKTEILSEVVELQSSSVINNSKNKSKFTIISSDEDEDNKNEENQSKKKLKKKRKRYIIDDISISDDEEERDDFEDEENVEDEENKEGIDDMKKNVDYDSEENEIEFDENEELLKSQAVAKARDFFEAEAELSGSDWDSADEDEKGLDDFEMEDGDDEKINENKIQKELGRMHAHNVLEEDKRDIRLLQEILLEDGELHGVGRERKFRWKNAESLSWNTENLPRENEDDDIEEAESELHWRKMRHERETFLKEQQMKQNSTEEEEILTNDSQFLQLAQNALRKSIGGAQDRAPIAEVIVRDKDIKLPFTLTCKRGSFLARSETTLTRLAEISRNAGGLGNGPKNSKNFLFTTVEKTVAEDDLVKNEKKRKAEEGTPKLIKKLKIADMSPSAQKLKNKKKFPI